MVDKMKIVELEQSLERALAAARGDEDIRPIFREEPDLNWEDYEGFPLLSLHVIFSRSPHKFVPVF